MVSLEQVEELRRVMEYPKFNFTNEQKEAFTSIVLEITTIVEISGNVRVVKEDPDGDVILETAIIGNANHIIGGDPHLLNLKKFGGIKIVTANEFISLL